MRCSSCCRSCRTGRYVPEPVCRDVITRRPPPRGIHVHVPYWHAVPQEQPFACGSDMPSAAVAGIFVISCEHDRLQSLAES